MPKARLSSEKVDRIVSLRKTGHSLLEIKSATGHSSATVSKYIKDVEVLPEYKEILRCKQGGSKERAKERWLSSRERAKKILKTISNKDRLMFLCGLYWGEGSKGELNLINGNQYLVRSFINCLYEIGVRKKDIRINIRVFGKNDRQTLANFWLDFLELDEDQLVGFEFVDGSSSNRLPNGMCRVRVVKGADYFKLIISMIDFIKVSV